MVVKRHGRVRRAKLLYLRKRTGKATRLEETFHKGAGEETAAPAAVASAAASASSSEGAPAADAPPNPKKEKGTGKAAASAAK